MRAGFFEKIYQRALERELGLRSIPATGASGPVVQTYSYLWQMQDTGPLSADLLRLDLSGAAEISKPPAESEAVTSEAPIELLQTLYCIGGAITPPKVISKVEPKNIPRRPEAPGSKGQSFFAWTSIRMGQLNTFEY